MPMRQKKKEKKDEPVSLARWIIRKTDTQKYRSGELTGRKIPNVDKDMLDAVGGLRSLLAQAREMEQEQI